MDFDVLIKSIAEKPSIEESVDVLVIAIADEIIAHPDDHQKNLKLSSAIVTRRRELAAAVSDNLK